MNMFTLFVLLAAAAAVYSLMSGVSAMATNHDINHQSSAQWMTWRVVFQALAVVLMLLAISPH